MHLGNNQHNLLIERLAKGICCTQGFCWMAMLNGEMIDGIILSFACYDLKRICLTREWEKKCEKEQTSALFYLY